MFLPLVLFPSCLRSFMIMFDDNDLFLFLGSARDEDGHPHGIRAVQDSDESGRQGTGKG
jgi:hypothetical protein